MRNEITGSVVKTIAFLIKREHEEAGLKKIPEVEVKTTFSLIDVSHIRQIIKDGTDEDIDDERCLVHFKNGSDLEVKMNYEVLETAFEKYC